MYRRLVLADLTGDHAGLGTPAAVHRHILDTYGVNLNRTALHGVIEDFVSALLPLPGEDYAEQMRDVFDYYRTNPGGIDAPAVSWAGLPTAAGLAVRVGHWLARLRLGTLGLSLGEDSRRALELMGMRWSAAAPYVPRRAADAAAAQPEPALPAVAAEAATASGLEAEAEAGRAPSR